MYTRVTHFADLGLINTIDSNANPIAVLVDGVVVFSDFHADLTCDLLLLLTILAAKTFPVRWFASTHVVILRWPGHVQPSLIEVSTVCP